MFDRMSTPAAAPATLAATRGAARMPAPVKAAADGGRATVPNVLTLVPGRHDTAWLDGRERRAGDPPPADADDRAGGRDVDWDEAHRLAVELDAAAPGPALAARLDALVLPEVDDAALVEALAGWERIASWAAASQAACVNELRRRRDGQGRGAYVGDEVAARLAASRAGGESKVGYALALEKLPEVWDALAAGVLDVRRSRVLSDELLSIPEEARAAVTRRALDGAAVRTAEQLRGRVRRAAIALDPEAANRAHRRARADRRVELHPVHDGMAWLNALLPAHEAVAVHTALSAIAEAQGTSDPRPMDARRADALVDTVSRWLDAGVAPDGNELPTRQRRRPHLSVTASATTLLGLDETACELAGYGPISAEMAREIAARATWTPLLVDAETGGLAARGHRTYRPSAEQVHWIVDRDTTCTFPGCRVPASRCDIDHNTPFDPARPAAEQTVADAMDAKCRHHHRMKTLAGWVSERDAGTGETTWTAPTGHRYVNARECGAQAPFAAAPGSTGAGQALDPDDPDDPDHPDHPDDPGQRPSHGTRRAAAEPGAADEPGVAEADAGGRDRGPDPARGSKDRPTGGERRPEPRLPDDGRPPF